MFCLLRPSFLIPLIFIVHSVRLIDADGNKPWKDVDGNTKVQLLIRWKVHEDGGRRLGIFSRGEERFSTLLRHKNGLASGGTLGGILDQELENVDDTGVTLIMDLPNIAIAAVSGPANYFDRIQLDRQPSIHSVGLDREVQAPDGEGDTLAAAFASGDTGVSSEEDFVPVGISSSQANQIPTPATYLKGCVVDTGYDMGHPDLPDRDAGHSITGHNADVKEDWDVDEHWHGTHVAGTIFAISNGFGVVGVNDDPSKVDIVITKAFDKSGSGRMSNILAAASKCIDLGAKVINMSVGGFGNDRTTKEAWDDIYDQDILLVAAAGNHGKDDKLYPASYPSVISVASLEQDGVTKSDFSAYNDQVEIAAIGRSVASTVPRGMYSGYAYATGTSMATPHVAGILLKVWSHFPQCTNNQMRMAMAKTAANYDSTANTCNNELGFGPIQGKQLYDALSTYGCNYGGAKAAWDAMSTTPSELALGGCAQSTYEDMTPLVDLTNTPSHIPSNVPSDKPSAKPSQQPTNTPSEQPSVVPSKTPSLDGTKRPSISQSPSHQPITTPSSAPTNYPSKYPSLSPSDIPSRHPSRTPTRIPSKEPSLSPIPSHAPSNYPSMSPSDVPSSAPTPAPTHAPTPAPIVTKAPKTPKTLRYAKSLPKPI